MIDQLQNVLAVHQIIAFDEEMSRLHSMKPRDKPFKIKRKEKKADVSTVPPVPQWTHDLAKMNKNDFQSICKLALPHAIPSEMADRSGLLKSPAVKWEDDGAYPSKTLGRFVHFLRCSSCGLESINKARFDSHLPCSLTINADPTRYSLHTCSACLACSTSQSLMDEHIDLFHKGIRAELIKTQELLRPSVMPTSSTPSTLSPTSVATNTSSSSPSFRGPNKSNDFLSDGPKHSNDNECLDLSTSTTTKNSATAIPGEEISKNGLEHIKKCHICGAELAGGVDELTKHLTFVHLIPSPLMLGQLAAIAAGIKSGQRKSSTSSPTTNLPPPPPPPSLPPLHPPSLLPLQESIPHGEWNIPSLMVVSSSLGQDCLSQRLPPLSFPFGEFNGVAQQVSAPSFPFGSKQIFGLNFDLPPLPLFEQNGDSAPPSSPSTSESEFKRARMDPSLGMEGRALFPRFPPTSVGAHSSSSLYPPPLSSGLLPRLAFPQQSAQSLAKPPSSSKGISEARSLQSEEAFAGITTSSATTPSGIVHNTLRKTKSDMKVIHRFLVQVKNDTREIHEIPPHDLCKYIQDFIVTAKKKDGHEYEPESLKAFVHSLERHLKYNNYLYSVLKDQEFAPARLVLSQRLNELRALSQANGSSNAHRNQTDGGKCDFGFSDSHDSSKPVNFSSLLQTGLLGPANPQALLNSIWLIVRTQFNVFGTQKHRALTWGQFQCVTNVKSQNLLRFTSKSGPQEVRFCHVNGGPLGVRIFDGSEGGSNNNASAKRQILPFDCVEIFNFYARLRPTDCQGSDEPLYLCPDPSWDRGGPWFKSAVAGAQLLSRIPRLLGMKPPRDPPPISEGPINPLFPEAHMQSLSQLRDNLLTTMNSFMVEKLKRKKNFFSKEPQLPPFLSPQTTLASKNRNLLEARISKFPQPLFDDERIRETADREAKPTQRWNNSVDSLLDDSIDETPAPSPKSLPSTSASSNLATTILDCKTTLTP